MMTFFQPVHEVSPSGLPLGSYGMPGGPGVRFCGPRDPGREELEAFVAAAFQQQHGATVRSFLPVLVGLRDTDGFLGGVAGYHPANDEPLYLEQYLAGPVEAEIARRLGRQQISRTAVAEIGNFACRNCVLAMTMVGVLARHLLEQEHDWVVFTATRTVRGIMRHMGLRLVELQQARPAQLMAAPDQWGRYYDQDPRVMFGYVPSWHESVRPGQEG
ncbi:MAG: thermostable hemolysin [Gammaproteobacteria bacterium]|nr:thermostable hemolysin [Gammaproteobacteria bacterium]